MNLLLFVSCSLHSRRTTLRTAYARRPRSLSTLKFVIKMCFSIYFDFLDCAHTEMAQGIPNQSNYFWRFSFTRATANVENAGLWFHFTMLTFKYLLPLPVYVLMRWRTEKVIDFKSEMDFGNGHEDYARNDVCKIISFAGSEVLH